MSRHFDFRGAILPWLTFTDMSRRAPAPDPLRPHPATRARRSPLSLTDRTVPGGRHGDRHPGPGRIQPVRLEEGRDTRPARAAPAGPRSVGPARHADPDKGWVGRRDGPARHGDIGIPCRPVAPAGPGVATERDHDPLWADDGPDRVMGRAALRRLAKAVAPGVDPRARPMGLPRPSRRPGRNPVPARPAARPAGSGRPGGWTRCQPSGAPATRADLFRKGPGVLRTPLPLARGPRPPASGGVPRPWLAPPGARPQGVISSGH